MMIKPLQVKNAGDLRLLQDLVTASFGDRKAWSDQELAQLAQDPKMVLYTAQVAGQAIGIMAGSRVFDELEIYFIGINASCQGQGWGTLFLQKLLEEFKAQSIATVFLEVRSRNTAARALYASCGFDIYGRRDKYYQQDQDDAILMKKHL